MGWRSELDRATSAAGGYRQISSEPDAVETACMTYLVTGPGGPWAPSASVEGFGRERRTCHKQSSGPCLADVDAITKSRSWTPARQPCQSSFSPVRWDARLGPGVGVLEMNVGFASRQFSGEPERPSDPEGRHVGTHLSTVLAMGFGRSRWPHWRRPDEWESSHEGKAMLPCVET